MRTVTFLNKDVQSALELDFVCTFSNTKGDPTAGQSFSHAPDDQPGPCGPRAGRQNVQLLFMNSDSQIFHSACGFMSPDDMLVETNFARELFDELQSNNPEAATQFGVMEVDEGNRLVGFEEKPAHPKTMPGEEGLCLASMGVYVFNTQFLLEQLAVDASNEDSSHDFGKDIIPALVPRGFDVADRCGS